VHCLGWLVEGRSNGSQVHRMGLLCSQKSEDRKEGQGGAASCVAGQERLGGGGGRQIPPW
jgi:hypothetical protein